MLEKKLDNKNKSRLLLSPNKIIEVRIKIKNYEKNLIQNLEKKVNSEEVVKYSYFEQKLIVLWMCLKSNHFGLELFQRLTNIESKNKNCFPWGAESILDVSDRNLNFQVSWRTNF